MPANKCPYWLAHAWVCAPSHCFVRLSIKCREAIADDLSSTLFRRASNCRHLIRFGQPLAMQQQQGDNTFTYTKRNRNTQHHIIISMCFFELSGILSFEIRMVRWTNRWRWGQRSTLPWKETANIWCENLITNLLRNSIIHIDFNGNVFIAMYITIYKLCIYTYI